jgi:hypothetical protein
VPVFQLRQAALGRSTPAFDRAAAPGQYGIKVVDVNGRLVLDAGGLNQVMPLIATAVPAAADNYVPVSTQISGTGITATWVALTRATLAFTLARAVRVMLVGSIQAFGNWASAGNGDFMYMTLGLAGQSIPVYGAIGPLTAYEQVSLAPAWDLAAGSYTANWYAFDGAGRNEPTTHDFCQVNHWFIQVMSMGQ